MTEGAFEVAVCAHLENKRDGIIARQLGGGVSVPSNRVLDTVVIEPGMEFDKRTKLTDSTIPPVAIESSIGPGRASPAMPAFDCHPRRAKRIIDRAVEVGFFERERRGSRTVIRQVDRYPDWVGSLMGIENKPDLDKPGALQRQLRIDVALGLLDRVVLATESHITAAHEKRFPNPVGIWQVTRNDDGVIDNVDVHRVAKPLDGGGVEVLEEHPGRTDIDIVDDESLAQARRRVAERAYGKGWRPTLYPSCSSMSPSDTGIPYCEYYKSVVDPNRCGQDCPGYKSSHHPNIAVEEMRDALSGWVADPPGMTRQQSALDRYD